MPVINEFFVTYPQVETFGANVDNLPLNSSYLSLNPTAGGLEVTGLQSPLEGRQAARMIIKNESAFNVTLKANSASSAAENQFKFIADVTLLPNQYAILTKVDEGFFLHSVFQA
jgi:hypothetical protein